MSTRTEVSSIVSAMAATVIYKFFSVIVAITSIVGAGSVWSAPRFGGWCLLGCALVVLIIIGFNFMSMVNIVLLAAGGGFALASAGETDQLPPPIYRKPPPL
jgi:hypothetical protein